MSSRIRQTPARLAASLAAPLLAALPALAQDPATNKAAVETARAALDKWAETRRVISQERRDWQLGKETLADRAQVVRQQIEALRQRIAETERSAAEAEAKRAELQAENERLRGSTAALAGTVAAVEARTKRLLQRLPQPIRERVQPLAQRIPETPGDSKLPLGERFANAVGILNEVNKFQREVTVTSEVRQLADGTAAQVAAIYLGLGQAFYVGGDGRLAGVGTAGPDAWVWLPANDAAAAVAKAIAVQKNEQAASFVHLPVRIQ